MLLLLTHLKSKYTVSTRVQTAFTTSVRAPCKHTARVSLYCSGVCAVYSHTNTNHHGHFYVCTHLHGRKEFAAEIQPGRRTKERKKEKGKEGEKSPNCGEMEGLEEGKLRMMGGTKSPCGVVHLVAFLGPCLQGGTAPCGALQPQISGI